MVSHRISSRHCPNIWMFPASTALPAWLASSWPAPSFLRWHEMAEDHKTLVGPYELRGEWYRSSTSCLNPLILPRPSSPSLNKLYNQRHLCRQLQDIIVPIHVRDGRSVNITVPIQAHLPGKRGETVPGW
ncbi:uncharacterized protein QC763_512207 [Podospora pseudopauciseta]|uniref:Uncharacterized protein n=1 Tax=Podospora pseudopauciseta TaxID=2093780 RepID=A0ABR0H9P4_9PEZI|nr:hypothetical protein QC763_512207 [Podospora pseudopauciseta]